MSYNLQKTDSGKNTSILMRKLREKWLEIIKNSGKTQGKLKENDLENSVRTLLTCNQKFTFKEIESVRSPPRKNCY